MARFRQVKKEQPHVHHDALEFPDGQVVLLTRLCVGQHATVLQLPAAPRTVESPPEAETQERVVHVSALSTSAEAETRRYVAIAS